MESKFLKVAFVSLSAVVAFSSCDKDDDDNGGFNNMVQDNTITAVVENGNNYNDKIDTVKIRAWDENTSSYKTLASTDYSNGGFTLQLPATVSDHYLYELFGDDEIPEGVSVSNLDVKTLDEEIGAYQSDSEYSIGEFYHGTKDWYGMLIYVDGDVNVTGSFTETEYDEYDDKTYTEKIKYNVHLKKGWNIAYAKETEKGTLREYEVSSQVPSGAKWYFDDLYSQEYAPSSQAKKAPFFSKVKIR
ncbi:MAG: hypothetical protein LBC48_03575 [Dysgonamonadaceae bacterium]|nr:hypothetical protein [Dysgonamonadaceae bacterium]